MSFVDVRHPFTHKLLFRYDPVRQLIEIQERKVRTVIDLQEFDPLQNGVYVATIEQTCQIDETEEDASGDN